MISKLNTLLPRQFRMYLMKERTVKNVFDQLLYWLVNVAWLFFTKFSWIFADNKFIHHLYKRIEDQIKYIRWDFFAKIVKTNFNY